MKTERILWAVAIVGLLAGLAGLASRVTGGHSVAAYNTYVPWGLWVAAYATLIGVSVGAFLVAALAYGFRVALLRPVGRIALLAVLAALAGGLLAIWLDLGHPERFLRLFLSTSFTSMMGLLVWLYTLYGLLLLVLLYLTSRDPGSAAVRWLSLAGLGLVLLFGGAEGALFGVVGAQALWESGLTPILFLAEGAASGVALVLFLGLVLDKLPLDAGRLLRWLLLGLLAAAAIMEWAEYSTALYAAIPARVDSIRLALFGPFWWVFWFVHVGLGLVVPMVLLVASRRSPGLALAGALVAGTAISAKLNLVIPALVVPELEGLRTAFTGLGLTFDYVPTLTEWLVTVGVFSVAALVFLAGYRFLPEAPAADREVTAGRGPAPIPTA